MLKGREGRQAREMEDLVAWLKQQPPPDVVCLSNALLLGMGAELKAAFPVPLLCYLQGEDAFLDALPEPHRTEAWAHLTQICRSVDRLVAPSRYFADVMSRRLALDPARVRVVPNGIRRDGYPSGPSGTEAGGAMELNQIKPASSNENALAAPVIGYFARQCPEKGLDILVEAFICLNQRGRVRNCRLKIGGSSGPGDEAFVASQRQRLEKAGLLDRVSFHPNLERAAKIEFLCSLTLFSVPARYGEAFGLYLVEALAAGVPVVQPRAAAFTEVVESSGAGCLCPPEDPLALAETMEGLLLDHERWRGLRRNAFRAARELFDAKVMAVRTVEVYQELIKR
jgi:glycosyltransferase involved in cell wall biosynthesis